MAQEILFDPLLPWAALWLASAVAFLVLGFALWRGLKGWWLRGLAVLALIAGIANPSLQSEDRRPLEDIVVLMVDETASQSIGQRPSQTEAALSDIRAKLTARENTRIAEVTIADGEGDAGTAMMSALSQALTEEPRARIAGVIALSDGRVHDLPAAPDLPAPFHLVLSGEDDDWDRRLVVSNAPAFAILGEPVILTLRLEDQGAAPGDTTAQLEIAVDGNPPQRFELPLGRDFELPVTLPHGGMNVLQFSTPKMDGELTDRNNAAVIQINGVRDRLRVLLVSGEPHPGERTWRNLLKADASVDLVHFTILRPPEKQDGVPVDELSLIAFPTRELFLEKIDEFDLIIFDRYKRRAILPGLYFDSIQSYINQGGAVLVAAGPDYAGADSLFRSPLGEALPGTPTARVFEEGFTPQVTPTGERHPVTEGLETMAADDGWGRWFRHIDIAPTSGTVVMSGAQERPLLVLDRVGQGRVALLASDHAWLWSRGFEGGGPQQELLRRLAHWMMKEPELEEEALIATPQGQSLTITRRTLEDTTADVDVTFPDGSVVTVPLTEMAPGRFQATIEGPEIGLYRLRSGDLQAVAALGPAAPREFIETLASPEPLASVLDASGGGVVRMVDGPIALRNVRAGRPSSGRGWLGLTPRGAYETANIRITALLPAWVFLLLAAGLMVSAWLLEGRQRKV